MAHANSAYVKDVQKKMYQVVERFAKKARMFGFNADNPGLAVLFLKREVGVIIDDMQFDELLLAIVDDPADRTLRLNLYKAVQEMEGPLCSTEELTRRYPSINIGQLLSHW